MAGPELMREIETKYDVGEDAPLPDLLHVTTVVAVSEPVVSQPDSTYYDTADLALTRHGVTLRRRTGGTDEGWHVKVPVAGNERLEIRRPLAGADDGDVHAVPADVLVPVRTLVRDQALSPIARVVTRRTVLTVSTATAVCAAEFCDDHVTATDLRTSVTTTWHEWEIELVDGDRELLAALDTELTSRGAQPAIARSKLDRALDPAAPPERTAPRPPAPGRKSTAGEAVLYAVAADVDALLAADPRVRVDEDDAVHAMRVATRRLRSVLGAFRPVFDKHAVTEVRGELAWLASVLGVARDAEVMAARYESALDDLDPALVRGPVRHALVEGSHTRYRDAHAAIVTELDGQRYSALIERLEALLADPPLTERAERRARKFLRAVVRRRTRALQRARRDAEEATGSDRESALHEVRKAAKRLRYTASGSASVLGQRAVRLHDAAKALQTVLGEHQDAVLSRSTLSDAATAAQDRGEDTFTYGILHEREGLAAARSLDGLADAASALDEAADF